MSNNNQKQLCTNIQTIIKQNKLSINLKDLQPTLENIDSKFQSGMEDGFAKFAGCELWQDEEIEIKDDEVLMGSGDGILVDYRSDEGTFGYDHEVPSRSFPVTVLNSKEFGIDYDKKPIKRVVSTLELISRYKWMVDLFVSGNFQLDVSVFDYNDWETHADINNSFNTEIIEQDINQLKDDPWLVTYWLIHMGLTNDERYNTVKYKALAFDFSVCCPPIFSKKDASKYYYELDPSQKSDMLLNMVQILVWFDMRSVYDNLDLRNSDEDDEHLFLIRRANLLYSTHSYNYHNPQGFEQWWLSLVISPKLDDHSLVRLKWFANNVEKFELWQRFDDKLANEVNHHSIPFISFVCANHPKYSAEQKSLMANEFLKELSLYQTKYKQSTNHEFARAMIHELRDVLTDTALLEEVMAIYFKGNTSSEKYRELYDVHFEKNDSLAKIHRLIADIEKQVLINHKYLENQEPQSLEEYLIIRQHNDDEMAKVTQGLSTFDETEWRRFIKDINSPDILTVLIQFLFTHNVTHKDNNIQENNNENTNRQENENVVYSYDTKLALLTLLFSQRAIENTDRPFRFYLCKLFTNEHDENIELVIDLMERVNTQKGCLKLIYLPFLREDLLNKDVFFDKVLALFDKIIPIDYSNTDTNFNNKRVIDTTIKQIFTSTDRDCDIDEYILNRLTKHQIEKVLDKALAIVGQVNQCPEGLGDIFYQCGDNPNSRAWLEKAYDEMQTPSTKQAYAYVATHIDQAICDSNQNMAQTALNTEFGYDLAQIGSDTYYSLKNNWNIFSTRTKENHILNETLKARENVKFPKTGVVFGADSNGNLLVVKEYEPNVTGGTVYKWDIKKQKLSKLADDIDDFVYEFSMD